MTAVPNVNSNLLLNYGRATINMIETEDESRMVKMIIPTNPGNLEKVACSLSVIEKFNFTSMILSQTFASVSKECKNKSEINHVPPKSLPHLRHSILV